MSMSSPAQQRLGKLLQTLPSEKSNAVLDDNRLVSAQIADDIMTCLQSSAIPDINAGFSVLSTLLRMHGIQALNQEFLEFLVRRISELLKHSNPIVVYQAIDYYAWLKDHYPAYRETMLGFLASEDLGLRKSALFHYETYCKTGEIEPLLRFQKDDYTSEIAMNSYLVYELRNRALEKIEKQLGKRFATQTKSEPLLGTVVKWQDWGPFLSWYESEKQYK